MDVLCPQCAYAYELDDALVTSAGTLVRCTRCDHKFRAARAAEEEPWVVQTFDGGSARFRNLADVQQAIVRGELGRSDLLARGRGPARPLGSIVELEGFFDEQARVSGGARGTVPFGSVPDDTPTSPTLPSDSSAILIDSVHSLPDVTHALTSGSVSGVIAPRAPSVAPTTQRQGSGTFPPPPPPQFPAQPLAAPVFPAPAPVLVSASERSTSGSFSGATPHAATFPSEPPRSAAPITIAPKARATGWVVAASLLVAVGSGAFLLGRRYTKASAPAADAPVFDFAAALADVRAGRIEKARDAADAASRVMGADPRLLALRAEVAVASADVATSMAMVGQRLATADASALALAAEESASHAMKASERAAESAPEAPETIERLAIACALTGSRARARQFVDRLGPDESKGIYARAVVAAVEGRDDRVERLERAFVAEPYRARLRAFAEQVSSRDGAPPVALLTALRASTDSAATLRWLDALPMAATAVDAGAVTETKGARPHGGEDFGAPFEGSGDDESAGGAARPARKAGGDPRKALEEGEKARRRGDIEQARALYQVALDANPLDSEALAGLGDCARDARDAASAIGFYRKALSANPSYLPARIGLADAQWSSGDRAAASKAYREIMENFPEGAYPSSVKERALGRPASEDP
jgi:predicted Zn finger-like uncharacterized protein